MKNKKFLYPKNHLRQLKNRKNKKTYLQWDENEYKDSPMNLKNKNLYTNIFKNNIDTIKENYNFINNKIPNEKREKPIKDIISYFKESNINKKIRSRAVEQLITKIFQISLNEKIISNIELSKIENKMQSKKKSEKKFSVKWNKHYR